MRRVTGLPDDQVVAWESKFEAQVVASLQAVMDKIASRIEKIQVASGLSTVERVERVVTGRTLLGHNDSCSPDRPQWTLVAVATTGPTGDDDPPPMTGELAIPEPTPLPAVLPETPGLPPGQPYISPDDLASIAPLWQQAVAEQVLPLVAQVFIDSAGHVRSQFLEAVAPGVQLGLPGLGSVAAEAYLAQARNTYEQVGDHLWATARAQLSEGFDAGESIPQLAARLRQSAGLSARTAVMVARTSVIEASNAGSMAMARVSGITGMRKSWQATNDRRTRPAHLDAEARYEADPIPLNEPFIVGGYPADYPAADTLPPSMRYRCRCTTLYLMPDQQPAAQPQLPGTSAPPAITRTKDLEPGEEGPLTVLYPKTPGEPGFDLADFPEPPPVKVRSSLLRARTDRELIAAWQGEMRAITGRDIIVQLPPDASVLTMREHAEGVLQMLERFPEARLRKISWYDQGSPEYAHVKTGTATLEFNARWASTAQRRAYLAQLRHDVSGWDDAAGPGYGWSVRGGRMPQATSWHEMAHILSIETLGGKLKAEAMRITLRRQVADALPDMESIVRRDVSGYATKNMEELIAEAVTDVMANGPRASLLSRELYDMVAREYRAKGFAVRTVDIPEGEAGFESFTRIPEGEVFPKAPAPRQRRVPVAVGRDLTDDHDLAVRSEREAERERALPTDAMGRTQLPEGYQGDYAFQELAKAQGFNGLPRIVADDGQWQALLDADYVPLYRGHGWAGGDGVGQVDAFNYGERYVGGGFAPGNNMSTRYETALHYADGHSAAVGHYALPTNARVISYPDLVAERDAYIARLPAGGAGDVERSLYLTADENLGLGRFGVVRGYDAMVVPRGESLLTDRVEEWVIFNRTKLVAYDDSAKGVSAARAGGKVTPAKMTATERARREKDAAIVSARQVGHLTRELDQMIAEGGEEAFRSGALFRRIQAKGSELGTPPAIMREFIAAARPSEKGSSLAGLRAAMERANAQAGVTRIGTPGEVWRFDGRRDDPTGAVRDIAEGTPVVVLRPGSLIEYKGKLLQVAPPRVRPATPSEIVAAERATPPPPVAAVAPTSARLATMKIGELRALAKERGITVPAGTRKADLVRTLDEAPAPAPAPAPLDVSAAAQGGAALRASQSVQRVILQAANKRGPDGIRAREIQRFENAMYDRETGYAGSGFFRVNRGLQEAGDGPVPAEFAEQIADVDRVIRLGSLTDDAVLYRGLSAPERFLGRPLRPGDEFTEHGYSSTSVDEVHATDFARGRSAMDRPGERPENPTVLRLVAPRGQSAVQISDLTFPGVGEVLLPRGLSYRVLADRGVVDGVRQLDVELIPKARRTIPDVAGQIRAPAPVGSAALPARVVAARAELARIVEGPVVREPYSVGGASAKNRRTGYAGGDVIEKDYTRGTKAAGVRDADAEELGALVMDALDVPTQTVLRAGPQRVLVSVLEGEHPGDIGSLAPGAARRELADTDGGRLLGLGDVLIGNSDRRRNWVRLPDGRPASYDLGGAFRAPKLAAAADPEGLFAHHFATTAGKAWAPNDMAPADLALIRTRLEALRPEFERLKRGTWFNQMMARLAEIEKRATGTRSRLGESATEALSGESRAVTRQAVIDERRAVADSLGEVRELLANGASERALASRARLIAGRTTGAASKDLAGVVRAMESGDADRIRVALGDVAQRRGLTEVGPGGDVVPFDPKIHELVGGARRPPAGTFVQVQRPGYSVRLDDGEVVQLSKAKVDTLTVEEIAERTAVQERKALREAARERNRVIEAQRGTARLLAEVDELAAKGASKTAIRERLDPALREAGQAYAGADAAVVDTISAALDSGDTAKIRASVTRASTKAKIKPIGRAGAKTTFDPDTMEGVGGIDIAPGAKVTVVRRGSTVPGLTDPLAKAQVTPVAKLAPKPRRMTAAQFDRKLAAARSGREALDSAPIDAARGSRGENPPPIPGVTEAQQRALISYRGHGFGPINDDLRGLSPDEIDKKWHGFVTRQQIEDSRADVVSIDEIFDHSRLVDDVVLWRGSGTGRSILGDPATWGDDLSGFTWRDEAYLSATASEAVAADFIRGLPGQSRLMLRLLVPKGSKAIKLSDLGQRGGDEAEMLLGRGATFRVVRDRGWSSITSPMGVTMPRVRTLDVEVVVPDETPPLPWDVAK